MCFRFASCLGVHVRNDDDFHGPPPGHAAATTTTTTMTPAPATRDGYPYGGNAMGGGSHGHTAAAAREQAQHAYTAAGADGALKRSAAARNNDKVANGVGNGGHYPTATATTSDQHER
ncbi:unnamed protein product [Urochloa decumbens]|uniref:Uncharacterized protein n=1 Tax=Urochloa decumbens TaxID=240449 RepID=A0ABC9H6W8_9POAL